MRKAGAVIAVIAGLFIASTVGAGEVWKVASLYWEPYSSGEMKTQGSSVEKLRSLLREADIELVVEFYPWKRAQRLAASDDFVGYFPAWPDEVQEGFIASPPIDWSWIAILARADSHYQYDSLNDLFSRYSVALVSSYVYPPRINGLVRQNPGKTAYVADEEALLTMLIHKRYDFAITDPYVMTYLADKRDDYAIKVEKLLMKRSLVLAIKKDEKAASRVELLRKLLSGEHPY